MRDSPKRKLVDFMIVGCFAGFVIDADKLLLIAGSFSFAIITLFVLKKFMLSTKLKVGFIYGHLIFLFFPFVVLTTDVACGVACMPCASNISNLVALALPTTLVASTIAGLFVIPAFYTMSSRKEIRNKSIINFVKRYSKVMNIKAPKIYLVDKAKPIAFSFRSLKSGVFLSVGLFDILNKKELEAVLLHELAHIKQRSSILKFSASIMKILSPLTLVAKFHDGSKEEEDADKFAISIQQTSKHLKSAKREIDAFG